jgi:hypothetical protein
MSRVILERAQEMEMYSRRKRVGRVGAHGPLIKSPAEDLPQDTQQEPSSGNGEDS